MSKELTGYPSIDKPWLKYYENKCCLVKANETIYNNFWTIAKEKPDAIACIDYKTEIKFTFSEMLNQADRFAQALVASGISSNHKVGVLGFNCLIEPIALLGANKIGATLVFVDPGEGIQGMRRNVSYLDLLLLENVFAELESEINPESIPVVLWGDTTINHRDCVIDFESFIEKGNGLKISAISFENKRPSLVVFSSGSTGAPKPIVHSDYSVNMAVRNIVCSDYPIGEKVLFIKAIPSHIGLGVITTLITALLTGTPYIQMKGFPDPVLDLLGETLDLLSNFKAWVSSKGFDGFGALLFAAPIFAKFILKDIERFNDLSFLKAVLLGGSKMTREELEIMDSAFSKKGLHIPLCNGYGQNEMGGAVALNTNNHNKNGSAGYPVKGTNIRIVDRYTHKDLPFNSIGLILEQSDSSFLYYLGMPEKTEDSKIALNDGTVWYDSTDLGYMDEDGFLYITGRTTRVVIRSDHKVSLDIIEEKINQLDMISEVAIIAADERVFAFVCPKEDLEEISDYITAEAGLSHFEIPNRIFVLDNLPRMKNGKVDYQMLEKEAESMRE